MYKQINQAQFLHKINLSKITRSVLEIGDQNNITEADIIIFSGMLQCLNTKDEREIGKILTDVFLFNKVELKRMKSNGDYEVERIKLIAKNFFSKFTPSKLSNIFNVSIKDIDATISIYYNEFILAYLKDNYVYQDDQELTKMFIERLDTFDYANAVRMYFLIFLLGRYHLIDTFTRLQYEKCNHNFVYALNREIIFVVNLLVRYGKNSKIDFISEETLQICNEAVDESNNKLIQIQKDYVDERIQLENKLRQVEDRERELLNLVEELTAKLNIYENAKVLDNQKVLVVGDEGRKDGYKEIVERHGGQFDFLSGIDTKPTTVLRRCNANNIVFFITGYAKHDVYDSIKSVGNILYVHNTGLDSLERKIMELKFKELKEVAS